MSEFDVAPRRSKRWRFQSVHRLEPQRRRRDRGCWIGWLPGDCAATVPHNVTDMPSTAGDGNRRCGNPRPRRERSRYLQQTAGGVGAHVNDPPQGFERWTDLPPGPYRDVSYRWPAVWYGVRQVTRRRLVDLASSWRRPRAASARLGSNVRCRHLRLQRIQKTRARQTARPLSPL